MCKALGIGPCEKHTVSMGCGQVSCRAGVECSRGAHDSGGARVRAGKEATEVRARL